MKRYWVTSIVAIAAVLGLSACAIKREQPQPSAANELGVFVNGDRLENVIIRPDATDELIFLLVGERFRGDKGREDLRQLLRAMEQGETTDADVPALNGLCGYSTAQFLRAAFFPEERRREKGLIGDFLYDPNTGGGHLTVDTRTEIFLTDQSFRREIADRTVRLQWHIDVLPGTYEVHLRDDTNPRDPFPGTVALPREALDPGNPDGIWVRGLDHKLFAIGETIVVRDIYLQIDDGQIRRIPDGHIFYRPCKDSCIDLLTRGRPPRFRIDFPDQTGYCLGRCSFPLIYNSK